MKRSPILFIPALAFLLLGANSKTGTQAFQASFEPEAQDLGQGKSPKFFVRRAHGLMMIKSVPNAGGGADLIFQSSSDLGDSFAESMRVNNVAGEVSDHGENSPQLLTSPDEANMYAIWNARDPKNPAGSSVRFSRAGAMQTAWSPAVTVNDDATGSHSFQTAAVAPDGTIYIGWLDGRDGRGTTEDATGGTTSIYITKSTDGGKTWSKNVRVSKNVCPCCRVTWGFINGKVIIGWRYVEAGDIRDIYTAVSADKGETWSKPTPVFKDGWKIKGCPHVGPAMAAIGVKLYIAYFTEGANDPAVYLASSADGGVTFGERIKLSTGTTDPTHPQIVANEDRLGVVFQARDAKVKGGWGKVGVYYREIRPDGAMSPLIRAAEGKASLTYPTVALGLSGRMFLGWTETSEGNSKSMLLRGRADK